MTSRPQRPMRLTVLAGFSLALALGGCSGSGTGNAGGTGGATAPAAGGTTPSTGGTVAAGGSIQLSGGSTTAGGTTAAGGSTTSGGSTANGGSTAAGGSRPNGGATVSGGTTANGGTTAAGGAEGGTTTSGGSPGGTTARGGSTGAGGTTGAGGSTGGSRGGSTGAGGTTGAGGSTGGSRGGTTSNGGTTASGGTTNAGSMRGLTPQQIVKEMLVGWNLGNTFDGAPNETSWGNPETTQAMVQTVATAGFKTMRIPVTWTNHIGAAPSYTVDSAWMAKVVQVAQWAVGAGMYAIVNTHHDADGQWIKFPDPADATTQAQVTAEVTAVWTQIATAFKSFNDYLIFECFNEPHGSVASYSGGDATEQGELNAYLEACVNAIRGTGGNNATRDIMIQPIGASPVQAGVQTMLKVSIISDPNLIISLHTYYGGVSGMGGTPFSATAAAYTAMGNSLNTLAGWLPNRAIVIGEWGSVSSVSLSVRVAHAKAYAQDTAARGMCSIWWDNGGGDFGLLNRKQDTWTYPTIVDALVAGATEGSTTAADASLSN